VVAPIKERDSRWTAFPILLGEEAKSTKRFLDDNGFEPALEVPMKGLPRHFQGAIKTREPEPRYFLVLWH
jgi:hypothetical protein